MKEDRKQKDFHMRIDQAFLDELDDLRADERPMPTRADVLRRLVTKETEKRARRA